MAPVRGHRLAGVRWLQQRSHRALVRRWRPSRATESVSGPLVAARNRGDCNKEIKASRLQLNEGWRRIEIANPLVNRPAREIEPGLLCELCHPGRPAVRMDPCRA